MSNMALSINRWATEVDSHFPCLQWFKVFFGFCKSVVNAYHSPSPVGLVVVVVVTVVVVVVTVITVITVITVVAAAQRIGQRLLRRGPRDQLVRQFYL
jgi:hypothetical protein